MQRHAWESGEGRGGEGDERCRREEIDVIREKVDESEVGKAQRGGAADIHERRAKPTCGGRCNEWASSKSGGAKCDTRLFTTEKTSRGMDQEGGPGAAWVPCSCKGKRLGRHSLHLSHLLRRRSAGFG